MKLETRQQRLLVAESLAHRLSVRTGNKAQPLTQGPHTYLGSWLAILECGYLVLKLIFQSLCEEEWAAPKTSKFHYIPSPETHKSVRRGKWWVKRRFGLREMVDTKKHKRWRWILRCGDGLSKAKDWACAWDTEREIVSSVAMTWWGEKIDFIWPIPRVQHYSSMKE